MEGSFSQLINSANSVLVVLPTKPYFDQVAAGLSLYLSLHDSKNVSIYCSSPMMVSFNRIIGIDKITTEVGNKNLVLKFSGYDSNNIEKVSYDIENNEFKLTVVPKVGFSAPTKEQLNLNYSGISADLVILIGGANDSHFPILNSEELVDAKVAHIGTRVLDSQREIMSFAKTGATTSELVTVLIKEAGLTMDIDSATNLVMGIEEGTSNFAGSEVIPETFEIFAYLLRSGGQRAPRIKLSPANFPAGAIPTKPFVVQKQTTNLEPSEAIENKEDIIENPPSDWLQPKIFKNSTNPNPDSFSENKG